jgi:hypothetical protein
MPAHMEGQTQGIDAVAGSPRRSAPCRAPLPQRNWLWDCTQSGVLKHAQERIITLHL